MADKNSASSLAQEGETYRLLKSYDLAINLFSRAIAEDENYAWAHAHLGAAYRDKAAPSYLQSKESFEKAIQLKGQKYAWAWANLGSLYNKMQEYDQALESFQKAIEIDPNYAWAYAHLGRTLNLLARYQEAEESLTQAIRLNGQYAFAYALRGAVYSHLNNYEAAVFDILTAIQLDNTIYSSSSAQQALTQLLTTRSSSV